MLYNAPVKNDNKPTFKKDDVAIIQGPNLPCSNWVHEVIVSKDDHIGGALVKVAKTKMFVKSFLNRLYLVESHVEIVSKRENKVENIPQGSTKRETDTLRELRSNCSS